MTFILLLISILLLRAEDIRDKIDSVNALPHHYIVSNAHKCVDIFTEIAALARSVNYPYGEARAYWRLSLAWHILGKQDKRISSLLQAIKRFEAMDTSPELAAIYGDYGYAQRKRDIEGAKKNMLKGIKLAEKHSYEKELAVLYDNYGVLQEQQNNLDSARIYYQRALDVKFAVNDTNGIPYSLNNLAGIYTMQGNFDKAFQYAAESDRYRKREKGEFGRALNLMLYGEIYDAMGKIDSAIVYFKQCLKKCSELNYPDLARYAYLKLTQIYERTGDYQKALNNQKKYVSFKDSLLNLSTNTKIAELEIAYETEKKDRKLAESALVLRRRSSQLIYSLMAIIALAGITFLIYHRQKSKRERLKKDLLFEARLNQAEVEKKITQEKLRISRELHDNIGSQLTFIINSVENLGYFTQEQKIRDKLNRISSFGRKTMGELRSAIWVLKQKGGRIDLLILKINELKQYVNTQPGCPEMTVICNIKKPLIFSSLQIMNLFRIVQEAVQNVLKYANARRIQVIFNENTDCVVLKICDDGVGFNPNGSHNGNGLQHMRQRCSEAGGTLTIDSMENGTQIACTISYSALEFAVPEEMSTQK